MEKLLSLVALSLGAPAPLANECIGKDKKFVEFATSHTPEIRIGKYQDESGAEKLEVFEPNRFRKENKYATVLLLRKKKPDEPINPRRIIQDIYFTKQTPLIGLPSDALDDASVSKQALLRTMTSLLPSLSPSSSLSLKSLLKASGEPSEPLSFASLMSQWRVTLKDSLDSSEKQRTEYKLAVFSPYETDIAEVRGGGNQGDRGLPLLEIGKLRGLLTDFAACLVSLQNNEPSLCPNNKEIRQICSCFASDLIFRCESELAGRNWWENPVLIDRARIWATSFAELQTEEMNRLSANRYDGGASARTKGGLEIRNPLIQGEIAFLEAVVDISEILRDTQSSAEGNRGIREELGNFKKRLSEDPKNSQVMAVHRELLESNVYSWLVQNKRQLLRGLAKSSQPLNGLNSLLGSAYLLKKNRALFQEEEILAKQKTKEVLRDALSEFSSIQRADQSGEFTNKAAASKKFLQNPDEDYSTTIAGSTGETWPHSDSTLPRIREYVSIQRKLQSLAKFNSVFFESPIQEVEVENVKTQTSISQILRELVSEWNEKAGELTNWLKTKKNQKLLDLDRDRKELHTNFSDELIVLIHMLDTLNELGLGGQIDSNVQSYLKEKRALLKEGIQLRNIAEFYNSLAAVDSKMLQIHKPLLIDKIVELENMIQNADQGLENKPHELHQFMKKATDTIQKFEAENSLLKQTHLEIIADFSKLFEHDLLTGQDVWKKTVKKAVAKVQQTTAGKVEKYVDVWTNMLGWQLLKVLGYQMKTNLLNIAACIPRIETTVKLFNSRITLYPSLPAIRSKLYSQIDGLISFPENLGFFGNWRRIVDSLPQECGQFLTYAYAQVDNILQELDKKVAELRRWIAIGSLDVQKIADNPALSRGEVWRKIVETVKQNRRELERTEDFVDAGCIRLRISTFKVQIDEKLTSLLDNMISLIDASMQSEKDKLATFLASLTTTLDYQPQSTEELRQAWETFDSIQVQMEGFHTTVQSLEDKVYLVKTLGRVQPKAEEVLNQWKVLAGRVKNFQGELKEKQEFMKGDIVQKEKLLTSEVEKFSSKWQSVKLDEKESLTRAIASEYLRALSAVVQSWADLSKQVQRVQRDLAHFGIGGGEIPLYEELNEEVTRENSQWELFTKFETALKIVEEKKHIGNPKCAYEFQDLLTEWQPKVKARKSRVEIFVAKLIEDYQAIWPALKLMIGEAFQREHWNQLIQLLSIKGVNPDALCFGHITEKGLSILSRMDDIKELAARAQGEVTIREAIQELDNWCATAEFELMEYQDSNKKKIPLIKEWTEMMAKVGDNLSLLQSIKDSKFFARFKDRIGQFDTKLGGLDRYLTKINGVQRRWLYLEPIFNKGALPSEKPRFQGLNDRFVEIMKTIDKNKKISLLGEINGLEATLTEIMEQIEVCQSALNKFLEETRNRFPRFFFLGDDDLLEILGQSETPAVIKLHLKKIFAGIYDVEFKNSGTGLTIVAMLSSGGESVELKQPVAVGSNLEEWLNQLEKGMFSTLEESLLACLKETQFNISAYPGQIISTSKEIDFSHRVHDALEKHKVQDLKKYLEEFLEGLTRTKNKLGKVDQAKAKGLIMDIIHQISVVDELLTNGVKDVKNWYWFKQLKYFLAKKNKKCQIHMCRAVFDYTYEYQGTQPKLVHTPLTDKCYLTLTQGMMLGLGGNPYGPAGTGKTESVKALGQAMARMVLVFNCDENLDYKSMGRIFIGLVKCGAWGCFDEFNRLIEEQLSAISQQIQIIQDAIREKKPSLHLLGKDITVDFNAGIFVTLNPAGKAYGGRSKLPDNLKLLFRPVAMARPDNELIAEVMLFAEGFKNAKRLAKKIVNIFTLCNQLLSKQQHYDWGLRALKVILTTSGDLMQITRAKSPDAAATNPKQEDEILLKALNDNTASKLTSEDLVKFNQMIGDILPDVEVPDIRQEDLIRAIENTLTKNKFEIQERQLKKIIQFHSALNQRIGVVIMGPSGSGKTTIWSVLREALQSMGTTVKTYVINPKAISRTQLLGFMDPNTREFKNGVLTAAARRVVKEPANVLNWIICDGDIDPKWIEALNSVLDDNHLLTLPTGERIAFGSNVNFIFETHDLKYASPATVSRMGMIYLNNDDVNISSLLTKWKKDKAVREDSQLNSLLKDHFEELVGLIQQYEEKQIVKTTRMGSILSLLAQLKDCESKKQFAIAAMRGLVSNLPTAVRDEVINKLQGLLGEKLTFLNYFDEKSSSVTVFKQVSQDSGRAGESNKESCVLTPYVQANLQILSKIIKAGLSVVLVGPEGGGKNTILKTAIQQLSQGGTKVKTVTIYCNSQTSSQQVIIQLLESCVKSASSTGPILRPKDCNRLVVYLRDVNLARPDEYNSTELVNFLQQVHSHRGFYDEDLEFTQLDKSVQFVVSMNPSSDLGRHELSTRLTACTHILYVDYPNQTDMQVIVKSLVEETLLKSSQIAGLLKAKASYIDNAATFLLEMFKFMKQSYLPENQKHYTFTPKDISAILESVLNYEIENLEELSFALLSETNLAFRCRLTRSEELSKYDSAVRKNSQSTLSTNSVKDTVFSAAVKKSQELCKVTTAGYQEILLRGLTAYQRENIELEVAFTDQLVDLLQSLDKVLSRPGGKAMLIGSSGSARKLATYFMCHLMNIEVEAFSPSKNYTLKEFRKELRRMLEIAGFQGKRVCMYLENHHIIEPSFMEDINSLLASNQIQGLFRQEEIESALKDQMDTLRDEFFGQSIYDCFLLRIKKNFRAVFSLDPQESLFARYLTDNPALLKKCKIIWVQSPSSDSLRKIGCTLLEEFHQSQLGINLDVGMVDSLVEVHRDSNAAPRLFTDTLNLYRGLVSAHMAKIKSRAGHLQSGVEKIKSANLLVDQLSEAAGVQKRSLAIKQREAEEFLKQIQLTYEGASEQKREAQEIKEFLKQEEEKIVDKRVTIKQELDKVQPMVDAAMKKVGSIPKGYLAELKSNNNPHKEITDVFTALFKLNGDDSVSWTYMRKTMTGEAFFKQILSIDARSR